MDFKVTFVQKTYSDGSNVREQREEWTEDFTGDNMPAAEMFAQNRKKELTDKATQQGQRVTIEFEIM